MCIRDRYRTAPSAHHRSSIPWITLPLLQSYSVADETAVKLAGMPDSDGGGVDPAPTRVLTEVVTRLRRTLRTSIRADYPWETLPICLLYTSPSPRDGLLSRMPSSA